VSSFGEKETRIIERLHGREEAGRLLAEKLARYANRPDVLVLGLSRGGVQVAYEIARVLGAPLDVLIVRKLGVPGFKEFYMGAISIGGARFINPDVVEEFHLSGEEVEKVVSTEISEMERLENAYRGSRRPLDVRGYTVILVDDGMVTGSTMRAGIEALKRLESAHIVVAVGVAPLSTYLLLGSEAEEVVSLMTPRELRAVGLFYETFRQVTDAEVRSFLAQSTAPSVRGTASGL
jgi:putative phosphoribosyl transferase